MLVPGGFGKRGIEGKIEAIRFARERSMPFFGICLGMQCAVDRVRPQRRRPRRAPTRPSSTKARPAPGGLPARRADGESRTWAARCGSGPTTAYLTDGSQAHAAYGQIEVSERHRHRYEFNNDYREQFDGARHDGHGHEPRRRAGGSDRDCRTIRGSWRCSATRSSNRSRRSRTRCSAGSSGRACSARAEKKSSRAALAVTS